MNAGSTDPVLRRSKVLPFFDLAALDESLRGASTSSWALAAVSRRGFGVWFAHRDSGNPTPINRRSGRNTAVRKTRGPDVLRHYCEMDLTPHASGSAAHAGEAGAAIPTEPRLLRLGTLTGPPRHKR